MATHIKIISFQLQCFFNTIPEDDELFDAMKKSEEGDGEFHGLYEEKPVPSAAAAVDDDSSTSSCPDQVGRISASTDSPTPSPPPDSKYTSIIIKAMFILGIRKEEDNRSAINAVKPLTGSAIDVWEVHRSVSIILICAKGLGSLPCLSSSFH